MAVMNAAAHRLCSAASTLRCFRLGNSKPVGACRLHASAAHGDAHQSEATDVPCPPVSGAEHLLLEEAFPSSQRGAGDAALVPDLRAHFLERFADPLRTGSNRFCWDFWNVPGQFTLLRTPADRYFAGELYARLEEALTEYGERVLGCRGISPVWLSYYVSGCRQELHTDSPHGPWAFVLSLTDWEARKFSGGETMLLQPHVLDYWRDFDPGRGLEVPQLMTLVAPRLGRLVVFDPRLPHGVKAVEGVSDPREARVVLHGWFAAPTPFFDGALAEEAVTPVLNAALETIYAGLAELPPAVGTLVARVRVGGGGDVAGVAFLRHALVVVEGGEVGELAQCIEGELGAMRFPPAGGETTLTVPFEFA